MVGTPHWAILPWACYCRIDPLGLNQNARWTDLPLVTGLTGQLRKGQFSSHQSTDRCTLNTHRSYQDPVIRVPVRPVPGTRYPVTPGIPGTLGQTRCNRSHREHRSHRVHHSLDDNAHEYLDGLLCLILNIVLRASVTPITGQTMSIQSTDHIRLGLMLLTTGQFC